MATASFRHKMKLAKLSAKDLAYNNCVYLNPQDLQLLSLSEGDKILIDEQQVFQVKADPKLKPDDLGSSGLVWKALHLTAKTAVGTTVLVEKWDDEARAVPEANTVSIVVDTYVKAETRIKVEELEAYVRTHFRDQIFCKDQRFIVRWVQNTQTYWLSLLVATIYESDGSTTAGNDEEKSTEKKKKRRRQKSIKFGRVGETTTVSLMSTNNPFMKLVFPKGMASGVAFNVDAEQMGIGGLDSQFGVIFRRAFASRLYPPELVKQLGIKHVKGMLLYGPPGTGKTLIARSIGGMLTENEPKVINGPEVLNKYVGQSEENIRKLFAEAIAEQQEKGDASSLHIIIFDEIDAICKQRGASSSSTGVGDTVVNQLLSMVDGVNALNNVLVIGMTNRKDLLDDALLRSGRLEVHIEIGLPDEEGRAQIFRIHTKSLREHGFLDEAVSISDLAARTKNYTGAEIEGVVRSAVSYAMQTQIDVENIGQIDVAKLKQIRISQEFFELALDEVMPELGKKKIDEHLGHMYGRGVIEFRAEVAAVKAAVRRLLATMAREADDGASMALNRQALLLRGERGAGKSAMAAFLANELAKWPFIRVVSADGFVGASDMAICAALDRVFTDAYKSDQSIVILDDIERLIGYTVGPRFSNAILQALLTLIRRNNDAEPHRKLLVVATVTPAVSRALSLDREFDFVYDLPAVADKAHFAVILNEAGHAKRCRPSAEAIVEEAERLLRRTRNVGIAHLLTALELAVDDELVITKESFTKAWHSKFAYNFRSDADDAVDVGDDGFDE